MSTWLMVSWFTAEEKLVESEPLPVPSCGIVNSKRSSKDVDAPMIVAPKLAVIGEVVGVPLVR